MAAQCRAVQNGLSDPAFEQQYGTEEQCRAGRDRIALAQRVRMSGMRRQAA